MTRLDLVVGPNGAGKSTFVELILAPRLPGSMFVNADLIAARVWPDDPGGHAYDAAHIASDTRERLISLGRPLIAETVCSHPSKLALIDAAKAQGYEVALHALMVPEDLSIQRVRYRVANGGHDVPEEKNRARNRRLWHVVADAALRADTARFWDNSGFDGPVLAAELNGGFLIGDSRWPSWTPTVLTDRWPPG